MEQPIVTVKNNGTPGSRFWETEYLFPDFVNSLPIGIYCCDGEGKLTFFNDTAVALWGYRPDINDDSLRFCACYKVWSSDGTFIAPEDTPMAQSLLTGKSFKNIEALVERPDGSRFYANVNINPVFDSHNQITGAVNVFQDISHLKNTEFALKESDTRYQKLVENLDIPLYSTDTAGKITLYNKAAADLWGKVPDGGNDRWCGAYQMLKPDGTELPHKEGPVASCLEQGATISYDELLIVRPDGSTVNVIPHPHPIVNSSGQVTGAINMLIDITKIRLAEQALKESEKKYRELASSLERKIEENAQDLRRSNEALKKSEDRYHKMVDEVEDYAIILLDKNGTIQNWNKGAEKIKGYSENEIIGKNFELFYLDDDKDLPQQLLKEATTNGKAIAEGWRVRKDGNRFWAGVVITALHDDRNNIIGFTKVTRDLTERKNNENKLKEYSNELEFQNRELEQFAYAASHDMKEPIRKIHLYHSYIAGNPSNVLDEKSREYLGRSVSSLKRMSKLIEDLLAYSMMTPDFDGLKNVNLAEITNEVVVERKEELEQKTIRIDIGTLPVVRGIRFQYKQLMDNLIDNAIKYKHPNRDGIIRINSTLVDGAELTELKADANKHYHLVSITDNGIGFDPDSTEKIFEIFQRLNNVHEAKGCGIGLAICKKIVQNHKGMITANGRPDAGASFNIYLPVED